jgi:hypothetical protein
MLNAYLHVGFGERLYKMAVAHDVTRKGRVCSF